MEGLLLSSDLSSIFSCLTYKGLPFAYFIFYLKSIFVLLPLRLGFVLIMPAEKYKNYA